MLPPKKPKVIPKGPVINTRPTQVLDEGFLLGYNESRNAFKYGVTANLSTLRNRVLDVGTVGDQPNYFAAGPSGVTRTEAGYEVGSLYLYKFVGVYQQGDNIPAGLQAGDGDGSWTAVASTDDV